MRQICGGDLKCPVNPVETGLDQWTASWHTEKGTAQPKDTEPQACPQLTPAIGSTNAIVLRHGSFVVVCYIALL